MTLKEKLEQLLSNAYVDEAIDLLLDTTNQDIHNSLILLKSRQVENERDYSNKIISRSDYEINRNQIINSFQKTLDLLSDNIKNENFTDDKGILKSKTYQTKVRSKKYTKYIIIGSIALVLLIILFSSNSNNNDDETASYRPYTIHVSDIKNIPVENAHIQLEGDGVIYTTDLNGESIIQINQALEEPVCSISKTGYDTLAVSLNPNLEINSFQLEESNDYESYIIQVSDNYGTLLEKAHLQLKGDDIIFTTNQNGICILQISKNVTEPLECTISKDGYVPQDGTLDPELETNSFILTEE